MTDFGCVRALRYSTALHRAGAGFGLAQAATGGNYKTRRFLGKGGTRSVANFAVSTHKQGFGAFRHGCDIA
jgi:hypothetical protein